MADLVAQAIYKAYQEIELETNVMRTHFHEMIVSILLLVFPFSASAGNVFVSPEGDDATGIVLVDNVCLVRCSE